MKKENLLINLFCFFLAHVFTITYAGVEVEDLRRYSQDLSAAFVKSISGDDSNLIDLSITSSQDGLDRSSEETGCSISFV